MKTTYTYTMPRKCPNPNCIARKGLTPVGRLKLSFEERLKLTQMPAIGRLSLMEMVEAIKEARKKLKRRKHYCDECYDLGYVLSD